MLTNVQIIEPGNRGDLVEIGSTVVIKENGKDLETFEIVGSEEADPLNGLISVESPKGRALIGRKTGDDNEVSTPSEIACFRVIAVH